MTSAPSHGERRPQLPASIFPNTGFVVAYRLIVDGEYWLIEQHSMADAG